MRSSTRPFGPAVLFAFLALVPMTGALAEDVQVENNASDGSQIEPAGAEAYTPTGKNLNSVPESSSSVESTQAQDSPFVKQILAARPNEDLVICIAGCFSGRDRVVYAQPSAKPARVQSMIDTPAPSRSADADSRAPAIRPAIQ